MFLTSKLNTLRSGSAVQKDVESSQF